jgi:hypothetical protein
MKTWNSLLDNHKKLVKALRLSKQAMTQLQMTTEEEQVDSEGNREKKNLSKLQLNINCLLLILSLSVLCYLLFLFWSSMLKESKIRSFRNIYNKPRIA